MLVRGVTLYLAEGAVHDTGVSVRWSQSIGLCDDIGEMSDTAAGLADSGGVYFIPGFHGLQAPVQDPTATAGFVGVTHATGKEQMLRAVLEAIAFSMKHLVDVFISESSYR